MLQGTFNNQKITNKLKFLIIFSNFILKGIQMLSLLVPLLISYLIDSNSYKTSNKQTVQLHEQSLQWLMKIGPKYPQEFKTLMSQTPELRSKLEGAVRSNQQSTSLQKNKNEMQQTSKLNLLQQKPTITLKTDFSNFS